VKHLLTRWTRTEDDVLGALWVTATVRADVNRNSVYVMEEMVIAVEPGDLFCGPDGEHFRGTTENFLNTIPVDLIKQVKRNNPIGAVM
jgi:hypothetical protein